MKGYKVCRFHGANPSNHGGRPVKTGKESTALVDPTAEFPSRMGKYKLSSPGLNAKYEEYLNDPDILGMQSEIALMRARLSSRLEQLSETTADFELEMHMDQHLAGISEQIGKLIDRQHKMEFAERNTVTLQALVAYAARIADIVNSRVQDVKIRDKIADDLKALFGGLVVQAKLSGERFA